MCIVKSKMPQLYCIFFLIFYIKSIFIFIPIPAQMSLFHLVYKKKKCESVNTT